MKKNLVLIFIFFGFMMSYAQSSQKVKVTTQKMGDGLYDFYAENPNFYPMQLELYFTEFENMSASCELPFVVTLQPGKHLLFNIMRTFIDLPGAFKYKFNTRVGAYPVKPDEEAVYHLPLSEGKETKIIGFDFAKSRIPDKISWGFKMDEADLITACREGVVCQFTEAKMRDSLRIGENTLTILHPDHTFGKYELFEEQSFLVNIGDSVKTGDLLGKVGVSKFTKVPHVRFSVYYVNARIDSINKNRIRNIYTFVNPLFTDKSNKSFYLEAEKSYKK